MEALIKEETAETGNEQADANEPSYYSALHGYDIREDVNALYDGLTSKGLAKHALELDIKGMTVIPPELVAPPEFTDRVREAVLDVYERRHGERLDYLNAETLPAALGTPFGVHMCYLLTENPIFIELMLNENVQQLVNYRIGKNACVSLFDVLIKANGGKDLELHTDELLVPPPYPGNIGGVNATYVCTPYTMENGPLVYVPGSHRYRRLPVGNEGWDQAVPVEAPVGSMIVWDGATWHGALRRKVPGLRLNVLAYYTRPHMRVMENYLDRFDAEARRKLGPRFTTLIGGDIGWGYHEEGQDLSNPNWTLIGTSPFR